MPEFEPSKPLPEDPGSIVKRIFLTIIKLLSYGLSLVIVSGLFSYLMTWFVPDLNSEDLQQGDISDWRSMLPIYLGMLVGTYLVTLFFWKIVEGQAIVVFGLSINGAGWNLIKGGCVAIGILGLSFLFILVVGFIRIVGYEFELIELLGFLLLFFIAALVEELIFRAYLFSLILKEFSLNAALFISALLFAILHIGNAHFTWIAFLNIFLGGYLLAFIFYLRRELYTPLGLHWIWNFFQGNILGFGVSGFTVSSLLVIEKQGDDWLTGGAFGLEGSVLTTAVLLGFCIFLTVYKPGR